MTPTTGNEAFSFHKALDDSEELLEAIKVYMAALETGQRPRRSEFIQAYPNIAESLACCLEGLEFIHSAAPALSGDAQEAAHWQHRNLTEPLGDFRLVREVGRGGMGVVYEAEQLSLGRRVALKVLPFAATMDPRHLQRFQNEARAAACLHHPHIVPVYAVGCDRAVHYFAMQFIDGINLAHLVARLRGSGCFEKLEPLDKGPDPHQPLWTETVEALSTQRTTEESEYFRSVARLGIQAAEALEHAHQLGIIHRDIKPANLLVDGQGQLWITDFGLAHMETEMGLTLTGDVMGTLRYMSPEQASGQRVADPRNDVYSLGATLYELLTLKPVFTANHRAELLQQVLSEEPIPPRHWVSSLPADLETILLKSLEKNPADRYGSSREFAEDLRRFLAHQPIAARRPTPWQRIGKWSRRNHSLVMLALVGLGLGLVGFAVSTAIIGHLWADASAQRDEARRQRDEARRQEEIQRRYSYAVDMQRAWQALSRGDWGLFGSQLDRYRPQGLASSESSTGGDVDVRTFAWYFLDGILRHRPQKTLHPKLGVVWHLAWSRDGRTLAMVGMESEVVLWDVFGNEERARLKGHKGEVNCVAFTPDGKYVISAGDDRTVRFWDPQSGKLIHTLDTFTMPVRRVLISPDGKVLAAGEFNEKQGRITLWNLNTREQQQTIPDAFPLTFAPRKPLLAITRPDNSVRLWNLEMGKECGVFRHAHRVQVAAIGLEEVLLYSADEKGAIRVWNIHKGTLIYTKNAHRRSIHTLAQTPTTLVSAGDDWDVKVWFQGLSRPPIAFRGHTAPVSCVALSPDGNTLASSSRDGTVKLWDTDQTPEHQRLARGKHSVGSVAISPNGKTIITTGDGPYVNLWDCWTGRLLSRLSVPLNGWSQVADFTRDGKSILVVDTHGGIIRLNSETKAVEKRWPAWPRKSLSDPVLSPLGTVVVFKQNEGIIRRDLKTGGRRPLLEQPHPGVGSLKLPTFSPDGQMLACAWHWQQDHVVIWEEGTGQLCCVLDHQGRRVLGLAFSPDGRMLAVGTEDRILFWEIATRTRRNTILTHAHPVTRLAFSQDGKTLASAASGGQIKIWDLATFQEQFTLWRHEGQLTSLAFTPDGRQFVSAAARPRGGWEAFLWYAGTRGTKKAPRITP